MYCIKCGVKLEETERKCPLCNTVVCHPDFPPTQVPPLYPKNKLPKRKSGYRVLSGTILFLLAMVLGVCLVADLQLNQTLDWFGYVAGALLLCYVSLALPLWFRKPNPVIFVPCSFVAAGVYLLYINLVTHGQWYLSFALPVVGGLCLLTCAVVTLVRYLKRGRLYIFGGAFILLGGFMLLLEYLLTLTFSATFIGWSIYPLVSLTGLGCVLIFVAICRPAREALERKFFF